LFNLAGVLDKLRILEEERGQPCREVEERSPMDYPDVQRGERDPKKLRA